MRIGTSPSSALVLLNWNILDIIHTPLKLVSNALLSVTLSVHNLETPKRTNRVLKYENHIPRQFTANLI